MSIFGPDFEAFLRTPEKRNLPDSALSQHIGDVWSPPSAGVTVTHQTANSFATWYAAVNLISGSVSRPRMRPFRLAENDIRQYEDGHRVSKLLNVAPNKYMNSLVFRRVLTAHMLVYGNAYAEIEWDNAGRAIGLWPLSPLDVQPELRGGELIYLYRGVDTGLRAPDLLHLQGLGFDGIKGYSVLSFARQALSLGLAAQTFGATFFANGAFPGLVASTDQTLQQDARERIRESWQALHKGPDRAHRLAVLEGGLKVDKLTIPPDDAQFLETRQFQTGDICQFFNLNPAMLGFDAGKAPGGNYEAQKISYVSDTVSPWWRVWEQEVERKLVGPGPILVEHDSEELLQYLSMNETRLKNKADAAAVLVNAGFDPEDVTDVCGLPPMRRQKAPEPAPAAPQPEPPPDDDDDDEAAREAHRALLIHTVGLLVRIEASELRRAAERRKVSAWAEEFYPRHRVRLQQALEPVVRAIMPSGPWAQRVEEAAQEMVARSLGELKQASEAGSADLLAGEWELKRPSEVAGRLLEGR